MAIQIKPDGIYVNGQLEIPANHQMLIDGVYNRLQTDGIKTINGESILGNGDINIQQGLLQTIFLKSPPDRYYFSTKKEVELPGLNTVIKPKSDNSYFIIMASISVTRQYAGSFAIKFRNDWVDAPKTNNDYHDNSIFTYYDGNRSTSYIQRISFTHAIENNSLEEAYIGIYTKSTWNGRAYSFYYNDRSNDDMRSTSTCIIMEVER